VFLSLVAWRDAIRLKPRKGEPPDTMKGIHDSPAWHKYLKDNPKFGTQSVYDVLLCLSTDGVNPFRSGTHSLWPICVKVLNLQPLLASRTSLLLLAGIVHGPRKPKDFQAYNLMIVDEALTLQRGVRSVSPDGTSSCVFRGDLFNHSCDLPANGLLTNQQCVGAHWGCLKCLIEGRTVLNRQLYGQARRYLPPQHPFRTDPSFGPPELRPPPPRRTITDTVRHAVYAERQAQIGKPAPADSQVCSLTN
jgi:hypothetical protein